MAGLRIFISSTCFDLKAYRAQLNSLLTGAGFDPVLSENGDILYDPKLHTHTSCVTEVPNADILVLMIGSRYGGEATPDALASIDFSSFDDLDDVTKQNLSTLSLSVTQAEVLKALEVKIPIFVFVDSGVHADHYVYVTNKKNGIEDKIEYPNIEKQETARYIFEFIEFLRRQPTNNAIYPFANFSDIEITLKRQLSLLFQRLVQSEREKKNIRLQNQAVLSEIRDLKAALVQSIDEKSARDIAKSVLKYRRLVEFLSSMRIFAQPVDLGSAPDEFWPLLTSFGVLDIRMEDPDARRPSRLVFIMNGPYFLTFRGSFGTLSRFETEWSEFRQLDPEIQKAVVESVDELDSQFMMLRRFDHTYEEHLAEKYGEHPLSSAEQSEPSLGGILGEALKRQENEEEDGDD